MNKILIVEDEILIQKSLAMIFRSRGFDVSTTASGQEALSLILSQDFDLIITDLMLSDINGFDIIEGSLKKYQREELPQKFVLMSAYSSEQIIKKAQNYQCLFISKPFPNISETVEEIIDRFQS